MKISVVLAVAAWVWVLPATLAAGVIAILMAVVSLGGPVAWYVWILLAPTLYVCWLIAFLFFCRFSMRRMGRRFPKPRYATIPGTDVKRTQFVAVSYIRMALVTHLPLVEAFQSFRWGFQLVALAYSPSVHLGEKAQIAGSLRDPDLTEVGRGVVIGAEAVVAAHAWASLPSRKMAYMTAPVKIGDRVTIGAGTLVSYGCTIGADSIIEPMSYLAPLTEVPSGEVWGGRPAVFQRKRSRLPKTAEAAQPTS